MKNANPPLDNAVHAHNIVAVQRSMASECNNVYLHKVYDLRASHYSKFREVLSQTNWFLLSNSNNVDLCVEYFYEKFYQTLSEIPVSYVKFSTIKRRIIPLNFILFLRIL